MTGSLRENALAVRSITPAMAARAQAQLFALAGFVGALGVLLPHPPRFNEAGMLSVQISSIAAAALLYTFHERVPAWLTTAGPFGATSATSAVMIMSGSSTSPYLLFYLWVAFYAFYFLSRGEAVMLTLFTILSYAAVVAGFRLWGIETNGDNSNEDISALVLSTGTVAVAGTFIVMLRERVGLLIRQLTDAARTDPLTGLINRRGFHAAVEGELARSQRSGKPLSVIVGDCDFFKQLNDSVGHRAADNALVKLSATLEGAGRRFDIAARIGGEEFALVLPETDHHEAFLVAERLRMSLGQVFAGDPVPLTMSFGVAGYPVHASNDRDLVHAAEDALYAAKTLGRDRTVLHSAEIEGILKAGRDGEGTRNQAQLATVLNLAEALDMRDTGTAQHSQTVGRYCEIMARELGLPDAQVDRIRIAGVLHDIGKIGVSDSVLCKPGPLTDDEFELMRRHPEIGARMLGGSGLDDIRRWILAHHERPDGRGYPHGLEGDLIPREARILAVADSYEAMTSDRVYRKALGAEAARAELRACAGSQFDPEVVAAFLGALQPWGGDYPAAVQFQPAR
ncbi:MAG: hypothetical protein QOC95_1512 [Thermoleophilaceae bacterium]|nr:hypothetical protein [Thermoleophilaceae bacterium]